MAGQPGQGLAADGVPGAVAVAMHHHRARPKPLRILAALEGRVLLQPRSAWASQPPTRPSAAPPCSPTRPMQRRGCRRRSAGGRLWRCRAALCRQALGPCRGRRLRYVAAEGPDADPRRHAGQSRRRWQLRHDGFARGLDRCPGGGALLVAAVRRRGGRRRSPRRCGTVLRGLALGGRHGPDGVRPLEATSRCCGSAVGDLPPPARCMAATGWSWAQWPCFAPALRPESRLRWPRAACRQRIALSWRISASTRRAKRLLALKSSVPFPRGLRDPGRRDPGGSGARRKHRRSGAVPFRRLPATMRRHPVAS